jgi:ribosomal protein S18 acetylase RimI-like enzyme
MRLYRECFPDGAFPESAWVAGLEQGAVYLGETGGEVRAIVNIDAADRWIYHLGVTASERDQGVGAYVLSEALAAYWSIHPDDTLGLSVAADNLPALRLYRRQGFAPLLVLQAFDLLL